MKFKFTYMPYVTSPEERLDTILKFAHITPGCKTVDLGAGDGRIVIAMAMRGAQAHGFEIIEKYVRRAKVNITQVNLQKSAFVYHRNFWEENLGTYDIVTIYGMAKVMSDLEKKLSKELKPGTQVISNGFKIPGWNVTKEENHVYLYIK